MGGSYRLDTLLFRWRDAFCAAEGPPATTRLVLWTLSKHMGMDGRDAFPNQETIALESALGLRAVKRHLQRAEELGWIERQPRRRAGRASWRYGTDYVPRFPALALNGEQRAPVSGPENGVRSGNIGVSEAVLVSEGATSSSRNSPRDLNASKKEGSTAARVQEPRANRDDFVAAYEIEERRQDAQGHASRSVGISDSTRARARARS
jgi:hypothetical protein